MAKIEIIDREVGEGPYKWRELGFSIDITDSPLRDAYIRRAEMEDKMIRDALEGTLVTSPVSAIPCREE